MGTIEERECSCCGEWRVVGSLGNIDMLVSSGDFTGCYDSAADIGDDYLRETARELIADAQTPEVSP